MSSSTDETPTVGLGEVDPDTLLRRLDEWSQNLNRLNRSICGKKDEGFDEAGHNKWPCKECVATTAKVVRYWHEALLIKAKAVRQRAEKEGRDLPMVDLAAAFFIASSVLDPATSVELEDWGAA